MCLSFAMPLYSSLNKDISEIKIKSFEIIELSRAIVIENPTRKIKPAYVNNDLTKGIEVECIKIYHSFKDCDGAITNEIKNPFISTNTLDEDNHCPSCRELYSQEFLPLRLNCSRDLEGYSTKSHIICIKCIQEILKKSQKCCPLCRIPLRLYIPFFCIMNSSSFRLHFRSCFREELEIYYDSANIPPQGAYFKYRSPETVLFFLNLMDMQNPNSVPVSTNDYMTRSNEQIMREAKLKNSLAKTTVVLFASSVIKYFLNFLARKFIKKHPDKWTCFTRQKNFYKNKECSLCEKSYSQENLPLIFSGKFSEVKNFYGRSEVLLDRHTVPHMMCMKCVEKMVKNKEKECSHCKIPLRLFDSTDSIRNAFPSENFDYTALSTVKSLKMIKGSIPKSTFYWRPGGNAFKIVRNYSGTKISKEKAEQIKENNRINAKSVELIFKFLVGLSTVWPYCNTKIDWERKKIAFTTDEYKEFLTGLVFLQALESYCTEMQIHESLMRNIRTKSLTERNIRYTHFLPWHLGLLIGGGYATWSSMK